MGKDKRKPLIELDNHPPKGKVVKFWWSAKDAAAYHGIRREYISLYLTAKVKSCRGLFFRYATPQEIQAYSQVEGNVAESERKAAEPVVPKITLPDIPVETIAENVVKPTADEDGLTPFERLLKKSSIKLNDNS